MIYFKIPLGGLKVDNKPDGADLYPEVKKALGALNPPFQCDDATQELHILCAAGGIRDYLVKGHLKLLTNAGVNLPDPRQMDMSALTGPFGTDAYKEQIEYKSALDTAREIVRTTVVKDAPDISGIDLNRPPADVNADLLAAHPGVCLGREHGQLDSMKMLQKAVEDGNMGMLFLEEFTVEEQGLIDSYLAGKDEELPPALKEKTEILKTHFLGLNMWEPVLKTARAKKVKVFAIDSAEAREVGASFGTEAFGEQRDVMMNAVVKTVMEKAIAANPGAKYMAVVGAAHAQTHRGGISGVTQMFGIPSIRLSNEGEIEEIKEDKSLRGMPSRNEQIFIDRQLAFEYVRTDLEGDKKPQNDKQPQLRAKATEYAARMYAAGAIPPFEDQLVLGQYERSAKAHPDGQNADPTVLRFAAERKLATEKEAAKASWQARNLASTQTVSAYVGRTPRPTDADEISELLDKARADAGQETLEGYFKAFNKLDCIASKMRGEQATPLNRAPLASLVDTSELTTELAAARNASDQLGQVVALAKKKDKAGFLSYINNLDDAAAEELVGFRDNQGRSLIHWAAVLEDDAAMTAVLTRCKPSSLDLPDDSGETALHLACKVRRDLGGSESNDAQALVVKRLLDGGANANVQDAAGFTPLHLAALTNNTKVLKNLFDKRADPALKDKRGWTALDTAIGGTSVDVENLFYSEGKATAAALIDPNKKVTTVDVLCAATKCVNPEDQLKVEQAYKKLYATESLRPILDLAALNIGGKRQPPGGGARIYVADGKDVDSLYKLPVGAPAQKPQGAFDESADVVMASNQSANDFSGVLMHELTHLTAQIVNGKTPIPFKDNDRKTGDAYIAAIEADARAVHLLATSTSPMEQRIYDRVTKRLGEYATRKQSQGLLEECLVTVPQLIAEFGTEVVEKFVPNLMSFHKNYAAECTKVAKESRFDNSRKGIDNQPLAGLKPPPPPLAKEDDLFVPPKDAKLSVDTLINQIRQEYTVTYGKAEPNPRVGIAFQAESYKLSAKDSKELENKLAKIKKSLKATLTDDVMTLPVSTDDVRKLIRDTSDLAKVTREKDLEKTIQSKANRWVTDSKANFLNYRAASGKPMSDIEIAETTAVSAETSAGISQPQVEVNLKKHAEMVKKLNTALGTVPGNKKGSVDQQMVIIDKLVTSVTGQPSKGVFVKKGKPFFGKRASDHVSIGTKSVQSAWLNTLKDVKLAA